MILFALSPETSDFLTVWGFIVGVLGCIIGVLGFGYTIYQVRKVKAAAEAAEEAAKKTLAESKASYERFVGTYASRFLSELQRAANAKDWKLAETRALDLAELLGTLQDGRDPVTELVSDLRDFGQKFAALAAGGSPKFGQKKWNEVLNKLHARLDKLRAPFQEKQHDATVRDSGTETPGDRAVTPGEDESRSSELGEGDRT
jgi:hypothetical protein